MQMSTLDSYQCNDNTTILCIWAWGRCRPSVWKRFQKKNEKERNGSLLKYNFSLTKSSQERKTARHCKTPMKINFVSIESYVWLFLIRFPPNRDCLLKLCIRGLQTFLSDGQINYYTTVRGLGISCNVIVSGYFTFCQIKKFFVNMLFFYWQNLFAGRIWLVGRSLGAPDLRQS